MWEETFVKFIIANVNGQNWRILRNLIPKIGRGWDPFSKCLGTTLRQYHIFLTTNKEVGTPPLNWPIFDDLELPCPPVTGNFFKKEVSLNNNPSKNH